MGTTKLGLEPLIGVEELAEYLGVPVQTIYDWRLSGRAPRAFKLGKHLRFAISDVQEWLEERHETLCSTCAGQLNFEPVRDDVGRRQLVLRTWQ